LRWTNAASMIPMNSDGLGCPHVRSQYQSAIGIFKTIQKIKLAHRDLASGSRANLRGKRLRTAEYGAISYATLGFVRPLQPLVFSGREIALRGAWAV